MYAYHVTFLEHRESIEKERLRVSSGGLGGPGVYAWKGPLQEAVRAADISLSDSHCEMSSEAFDEFLKTLCIFESEYDESESVSVAWDDYLVFKNPTPPKRLQYVGCFYYLALAVSMQ